MSTVVADKKQLVEKAVVRWTIRRDLSGILAIEQKCFSDNALTKDYILDLFSERNIIGKTVQVEDRKLCLLGRKIDAKMQELGIQLEWRDIRGSKHVDLLTTDLDLQEMIISYRILEWNAPVVGCCIYELGETQIDLLSIAVDPDWQRFGVGRKIIDNLKKKLSPQRRKRIVVSLETKDDTPVEVDAIKAFFFAMGFTETPFWYWLLRRCFFDTNGHHSDFFFESEVELVWQLQQ